MGLLLAEARREDDTVCLSGKALRHYIDEAQYLAGIVAGHTSRSGKLGFVAAKPIPQVLRNINAFTLGAQAAKPQTTTQVIFTGDWALPIKEAEKHYLPYSLILSATAGWARVSPTR